MRGIPDSDKDAVARWDKSVAASKKLAKKGKGKIKGLLDKYLTKGKFKYINPKGVNTYKKLAYYVDDADSVPELEEWGEVAKTIKMSPAELKELKALVAMRRKSLPKVDKRG
jgi:hypothetical protein